MRRMGTILMFVAMLFTLVSCNPNSDAPTTGHENGRFLTIEKQIVYQSVPYVRASAEDWLPVREIGSFVPAYDQKTEIWVNENDPRYHIEGNVVKETKVIEQSDLAVYVTVSDYLESGGPERQFLIRPLGYEMIYKEDAVARDAFLQAWCSAILSPGGLGEVIPELGLIRWWGTNEAILSITEGHHRALVCFAEDFPDIYGMTIEKAQELVRLGWLDIWCRPIEGKPLHGKSGAEIENYLKELRE